MTQRVTIEPFTGHNEFGEATCYGTGKVYEAAVVGEMKRVLDSQGVETPTMQSCYLMSNDAVRPEDRITLSTGDVGSTEPHTLQPPIVAVARYPFTEGQFCTVVHLGGRMGN